MPEISIAFQTDKSAAEYVELAQTVNQYHFDAVSVYSDLPFHPGFAALMLMTPHIQSARAGIAAISPSRVHPIDIASQTALLSQLAKSGVYIGFCRGAWLKEHGINELRPPVQAIREAIDATRYMLSGQTGGYNGQIFQIAEHVKATYPLPQNPIPVLIGTWGPKLCAVAGELADEVKIGGSANPEIIPIIQNHIATGETTAGRKAGATKIVMGAVSIIDEDRKQARRAAKQSLALYLPVVARLDPTIQIEPELIERIQRHANYHEYDQAANLISDALLDRFAFAGAPDDIIQQVESLFEAGAHRIEFGTPHGLQPGKGIQLLGEKVIPALKSTFEIGRDFQ